MVLGLRASDAPTINECCGGDRRLLLRLGNLLQQDLAITEMVLRELPHQNGLRDLLLDKQLGTLVSDEDLERLAGQHGLSDFELILTSDSEGRVLALADEVDNPLLAALSQDQQVANPPIDGEQMHSMSDLLPTLTPQLRTPIEHLMQAQADEHRAAALEQLRYQAPPLEVVGQLMRHWS